MLAVLRVLRGACDPLARCPRVLLVAWWGSHSHTHDDGGRDQGLLQGAPPDRRCRPLPDDQAPGGQMHTDHGIDPSHCHPVTQPQAHAKLSTALASLGKERRAGKAAVCDERPAHCGWTGRLELPHQGQCRDPKAPFGPGLGEHGPANRERAASYDNARPPDCPAPEPGRVQRDSHGLGCYAQCQRQTEQCWADRGLVEGWPTPPAPYPPPTRPARTRVCGR